VVALAVVLLLVATGVGGSVYARRHRARTLRRLSQLVGQVVSVSAGSEGEGFSAETLDGTLVGVDVDHLLVRPKFDPVPPRFERMEREGGCLKVPLLEVLDVTSGGMSIRVR
jgi:hypothetical protein